MTRRLSISLTCLAALAVLATPLVAQDAGTKPTKKLIGPVNKPSAQASTAKTVRVPTAPKKKLSYGLRRPRLNFSPPQAIVDQSEYNWGAVMQGEVVEHSFTVRNTGGAPLKIERVKPSCGCTTVDYNREIAPGSSGEITLRIETKKFQGTVKKTAQVSTNASRTSQQLIMTGKIDPVVKIEPKLPRIDVIAGVSIEPTIVAMSRASAHAFTIDEVSTKSTVVQVELETVQAGALYNLKVMPVLPDSSKKYHYAQIDAKVTVGDKKFDLPIRVSITVKERIEASPGSVYFSRRDTEKLKNANAAPATKTVKIKSLDPDHSFQITDVEVQGTRFTVERKVIAEGKEYQLDVRLPPLPANDQARRIVEKIIVKTNDAKIPELKINATASIGRPTTRPTTGTTGTSRYTPKYPPKRTSSITPKGATGSRVVPIPSRQPVPPKKGATEK